MSQSWYVDVEREFNSDLMTLCLSATDSPVSPSHVYLYTTLDHNIITKPPLVQG